MTIYQFIAMNETRRARATWNGTLLGNREESPYKVFLYAINDFYVEVFYHQESNRIQRFRPFKGTALLDPYLEQINVGNLI